MDKESGIKIIIKYIEYYCRNSTFLVVFHTNRNNYMYCTCIVREVLRLNRM
jgi:hypothetical protein